MSVILAVACARAEQLMNTALEYSPESDQLFKDIAGKSLRVTSHLPPGDVIICCKPSEITLQPATETPCTAGLSGSMLAVALLASETQPLDDYEGPVTIDGDREFAETLRQRLQSIEIDWEAWLATLVGDIPAHLFANAARQAANWQDQASSRSADGLENYFQEEFRSAPFGDSLEQLKDGLVKLGSDREQLRQHLDTLKARLLRITG